MIDATYIQGELVNGIEFPHVDVYNATLKTTDRATFESVFTTLLPHSTIACLDGEGACLVINGSNIRIYFKREEAQTQQNVRGSKKSSFVKV
jgi:hypothetical protein